MKLFVVLFVSAIAFATAVRKMFETKKKNQKKVEDFFSEFLKF